MKKINILIIVVLSGIMSACSTVKTSPTHYSLLPENGPDTERTTDKDGYPSFGPKNIK